MEGVETSIGDHIFRTSVLSRNKQHNGRLHFRRPCVNAQQREVCYLPALQGKDRSLFLLLGSEVRQEGERSGEQQHRGGAASGGICHGASVRTELLLFAAKI